MSTDSRVIAMTGGYEVRVDASDFEALSGYRWQALVVGKRTPLVYAIRRNGRNRTIKMHREITDAPTGMQVDHIDGDSLNNCRSNLRICTNQENSRNTGLSAANSSGYKGVARFRSKWRAYIVVDAKQKHLGFFLDKLEAAQAYDQAAKQLFGSFARTNF